MSKIRLFDWGSFEYFEHCPFCGSVAVDFDRKTFHCPDCGATVTFDLTESEDTRDGESDVKRIVQLWNKRARNQITADDLCVMAQKVSKEKLNVFRREVESEIWSYVVKSARIGKFECELPKEFASPDYYRKLKFDVTEKEDSFIVSWKKDIKWDNEE